MKTDTQTSAQGINGKAYKGLTAEEPSALTERAQVMKVEARRGARGQGEGGKPMTKTQKITYWLATVVLASALMASGIQQLLRVEGEPALAPPYAWGIVQLGYPIYVLTILGIWKPLGAIAILIPKYPLLKEWAYAGIFFLLTAALFSHIASGHPWGELGPAAFLLGLTILSWYFRPAARKLLRSEV
jgi:uncharacterized membrane protein YphA (DoxX/SURF4 family)